MSLTLVALTTAASAEVRYVRQRVKPALGERRVRITSWHTEHAVGSSGIIGSLGNARSTSEQPGNPFSQEASLGAQIGAKASKAPSGWKTDDVDPTREKGTRITVDGLDDVTDARVELFSPSDRVDVLGGVRQALRKTQNWQPEAKLKITAAKPVRPDEVANSEVAFDHDRELAVGQIVRLTFDRRGDPVWRTTARVGPGHTETDFHAWSDNRPIQNPRSYSTEYQVERKYSYTIKGGDQPKEDLLAPNLANAFVSAGFDDGAPRAVLVGLALTGPVGKGEKAPIVVVRNLSMKARGATRHTVSRKVTRGTGSLRLDLPLEDPGDRYQVWVEYDGPGSLVVRSKPMHFALPAPPKGDGKKLALTRVEASRLVWPSRRGSLAPAEILEHARVLRSALTAAGSWGFSVATLENLANNAADQTVRRAAKALVDDPATLAMIDVAKHDQPRPDRFLSRGDFDAVIRYYDALPSAGQPQSPELWVDVPPPQVRQHPSDP